MSIFYGRLKKNIFIGLISAETFKNVAQILYYLFICRIKFMGNCCYKTFETNICDRSTSIQGVSEISTLILTGNRTHQKEQLFSLPFWRKMLRSGLKK
jgi:hypothetical protein